MTDRLPVVLFVDDEPAVLDTMKLQLPGLAGKWRMLFAGSGEEALAVLEQAPVDVLVSDMQMPGMDGAALLEQVRDRYPAVARIILSGHSEESSALRAMRVSHQFLNKPCEPGRLEKVIERTRRLQTLVGQEAVRRMVGRIERLPSPPTVYLSLQRLLMREDCSAKRVAEILIRDQAICAKVLQLVNSAYFGLARAIAEPEEAVVYLGFETLKNVVLAVEAFQATNLHGAPPALLQMMQQHAMHVASLASKVAPAALRREAYIAGLLHDVGKLIVYKENPREVARARQLSREQSLPAYLAEAEVFGVGHAEIGAYLLGLWGLPQEIVEAVADHHEPARAEAEEFGILHAVYTANLLIHEEAGEPSIAGETIHDKLDEAALAQLGVAESLAGWREMARGAGRAAPRN